MLRQILSISGRPGLYKIVSQGNRAIIVEDLQTGKRMPAHERNQIVSLGDVSMYTIGEDMPLDQILDRVYAREEGKPVDIKALEKDPEGLRSEFEAILPDHDQERVRKSDIRKLFQWYNILIGAGYTRFTEEKDATEGEAAPEADATPEAEK